MKQENKTYWMAGIAVVIVIVASIIFVNIVNANNGNGNGNGNGQGNGKSDKEDMKDFKVLKSDGSEFPDEPELEIEENGDVNFLVKMNMSMCGANVADNTYILVPDFNTSNFMIVSKRYPGLGDCIYRNYYDSFKFNLLEKQLSAGKYSIYKNVNGQPLFMLKIKIKGTLPSATPSGTVITEEDKGIIHDILVTLNEILKYIKINWMGQNETIQPNLAVETVKWVRVGEQWNVYANYTDQHGKPLMGVCSLNTDKWGVINMNYEEKMYVAKHIAEPVGRMKWTVSCK